LGHYCASTHPDDHEKALVLFGICTEVQKTDSASTAPSGRRDLEFVGDRHWLREAVRAHGRKLGEVCGERALRLMTRRLRTACSVEDDRLSYVWHCAIEDHEQNHFFRGVTDVLVNALREIAHGYVDVSGERAKAAIAQMLGSNANIVKRVALHVIDEHFALLGVLFFEHFTPGWFGVNTQHEVFRLLQRHFQEFTAGQQEAVISAIVGLRGQWFRGDSERNDQAWRLQWLSAIRGLGNPEADRRYEETMTRVGGAPEHPDFPSYMESHVGHRTPLTQQELFAMSIPETVRYLDAFQPGSIMRGPDEDGLAEVLGACVTQDPDRYAGGFGLMASVKPRYLTAIFFGLRDAWSKKAGFDWTPVLQYGEALAGDHAFWTEYGLVPGNEWSPRHSLVSSLCSLIEKGLENDEWAMDEALTVRAGEVLDLLLQRIPSRLELDDPHPLDAALNTVKGRCLAAFLDWALRLARLEDREGHGHDRARAVIRPMLERELERCQGGNLEFSALAGEYVLQLGYLDREWMERNVDQIFGDFPPGSARWAALGYSCSFHLDRNLHDLLKERGILQRMLDLGEGVREHTLRECVLAYVLGYDELEGPGSLLGPMIQAWYEDDVIGMVKFLEMQGGGMSGDASIRERVMAFWRLCDARGGEVAIAPSGALASLLFLAVYLDVIDSEAQRWMVRSAGHLEGEGIHGEHVQQLARLAPRSPVAVAAVFLEALRHVVPLFPDADVRTIVEEIYKAGLRDQGNQICVAYGRGGAVDYLRDLYERYGRG